jgi:hypothetical protein
VMVFDALKGAFERATGAPPLAEVTEFLKALPDEGRMKLLRDILREAAKVKGDVQELRLLVEMVRLIHDTPEPKIAAVRDMVAKLEGLIRLLPPLKEIPLGELLEELRREGRAR